MNRKQKIVAAAAGIIVALGIGTAAISSQNSSPVQGNGQLEALSPLEMKKFMKEDGTGFVMCSFDEEKRVVYMNDVKKALKENDVDAKELNIDDPKFELDKTQSDYGVKQHINTLAVYKKGKIEKQIEFDEYEPSELESELSHFIKTSKELYFEE
ncbi:hypothetical protein H8R29_28600 (plasmid) [Priestia megaterium]|nr:hypothetical protein [Priestia megaterium]KGJ85783.1 hypothetical protein BMT_20425 [Priestia megaterium NBRC 15308 = ATCC 14581]MDR4235194.1 hypothetical protein [Priestia megaterium]MED4399239.1 hypothetical protein [Priestia megaterium]MED4737949.1 hypothetical protein [Priestia megaterium]NER45078.1 hypothetical protein [Priestia megaterium NBRC 15308 = ATCC 14581]